MSTVPDDKPQVRIVSDGLPTGTTVYVDGVPIEDVYYVAWSVDCESVASVTLKIHGAAVEVVGEIVEA